MNLIHIGSRDFTRLPASSGLVSNLILADASTENNASINKIVFNEKSVSKLLYITKTQEWSSVFLPSDIFDTFVGYGKNDDGPQSVIKDIQCESITVDDVISDSPLHQKQINQQASILLINAQGATFEILQGAKHFLAGEREGEGRAGLVFVESEFIPLYDGQKLFGEVFTLLTTYGFSILDMNPLRVFKKTNKPSLFGKGALMYCDAVFYNEETILRSRLNQFQDYVTLLVNLGYFNLAVSLIERRGDNYMVDEEYQRVSKVIKRRKDLCIGLLRLLPKFIKRRLILGILDRYYSIWLSLDDSWTHQKDRNRIDREFIY